MHQLGRWIQAAGLIITPLGILLNLQEAVSVWQSLTIGAFGGLLFMLGLYVQGLSPPKE